MTDPHAAAASPPGASFERMATGALAGAALGAIAWVVAARQFGMEFEFVAFLLGWLAAKGAIRATPRAGGWALFGTATAAALVGFAGAKYANFVLLAREQVGTSLGWIGDETWDLFVLNLDNLFGFMDVVWLGALVMGAMVPLGRLIADRRQAREAAEAAGG